MRANATRTRKRTSQRAAVTAEFAAAVAIFVPIILVVVFACYEVAMAFMIYNALNYAAQTAAIALSKAYGGDASYATSTTKQQALFAQIKYANMVVSPLQFSAVFPPAPANASWLSNSGDYPTVIVVCKYTGGQYGLPPFPNPDPLKLSQRFSLQASATAYLE
jgi:Flp pilus assembly protein TadG